MRLGRGLGIVFLLLPMVISAGGVAGICYLCGAGGWRWFHWLILSPVVYLAWLLVYLGLTAAVVGHWGHNHPKPRYVEFGAGANASKEDYSKLTTVLMCYHLAAIFESLPLANTLRTVPACQRLALRSYAPSVQIGQSVSLDGALYDPDLTEIGDEAVIGGRSAIVAHGMSTRGTGVRVFVSAPVKIGRRATIGGEARVSLGCNVGEDAIVEPGSFVPPFTNIPPGEVWGGNPAVFLRKRDSAGTHSAQVNVARAHATPIVTDGGAPNGCAFAPGGPDHTEVRKLVAGALSLAPENVPDDLIHGVALDSLGRVAIGAAIMDRYSVPVAPAQLWQIKTIQDIAGLIASASLPSAGATSQPVELPDDAEMLPLLDPQEATRALAERYQGGETSGRPLSVVIAASFTAEPLETTLKLWGKAFGYEIDCQFGGFDRIVPTLLDANGLFSRNGEGIGVVLTRPEDLFAGKEDQAIQRMDQVLDAVEAFVANEGTSSEIIVGTLPPVVSSFTSSDRRAMDALRTQWSSRLAAMSRVHSLDFARLVERLGIEAAADARSEVLTRAPYSARLYQQLAIETVRQIVIRRRSPAKVIAIDCDNTLWGGVVGEVGLDGIQLGPDGPGRSFQLFQKLLKQLKDRGILLALVSRNEEADVRQVFADSSEMILRPMDIAAWRVNWKHKSENLVEIANELNLGLESIIFLDDDPVVRLEVKTRQPGIHVVPLPADPSLYCDVLSRLWLLDLPTFTETDAARTRMLQEERARQETRKRVGTLEDFVAGLDLHVEMRPPNSGEWSRVAQLTQRTNQFNLSLKRRTVEELRSLSNNATIYVAKAKDCFGDYGLVGLSILTESSRPRTWQIDTLLMSCRALGRNVEDSFMHGIAQEAVERGCEFLTADYVPGPRNQQIKDFLQRMGFHLTDANRYELPLSSLGAAPKHVTFERLRE